MGEEIEELKNKFSDFVVDFEDFEEEKEIGKGGFSEVFLAKHVITGKLCALKKLKFKDLKEERYQFYFREIDILSKCDSMFLLSFIGFSVNKPYIIVTEYVPNGSLFDALRGINHKSLSGTQKTKIAMGIAHGFKRLHELGIIHRDLKSLNILLDYDDLPRICDFGLSRYSEDKTEFMTANVGTPHWMAPELFDGGKYSNKVDVYAYGMLLWEILTESSPFSGKTAVQIAFDICKKMKRPSIPTRTPSALKDLINLCWAQDPDKRPSFSQIYSSFAKGKVSFSGSEKDEISQLAEKVEITTKKWKEFKKKPGLSFNRQQGESNRKPSDIEDISKSPKGKLSFETLADIKSPNFESSLIEISQRIQPEEANKFFTDISIHFIPSLPEKTALLLLKTVEKLILSNDAFYNVFVSKQLHLQLSFPYQSLSPYICTILLYIFTKSPQLINDGIVECLFSCINAEPSKVMRLIQIYLLLQPPPIYFWKVADFLFDNSHIFFKGGCAQHFLKLIYHLFSIYPEFKEKRLSKFFQKSMCFFETKDPNVINLFSRMLCVDKHLFISLDQQMIIDQLKGRQNANPILSILLRIDGVSFSSSLLSVLFEIAKNNDLAYHLICQQAQIVESLNIIAQLGNIWLQYQLPTLENTTKLVIMALSQNDSRDIISQHQSISVFLEMIAKSNNSALVCHLLPIVSKLKLSSTVLSLLDQSSFFQEYYSFVKQSNNPDLIAQSMVIIEYFARVGYCNGFVYSAPIIKLLLDQKTDIWAEYLSSALVSISCYNETKSLITNDIIEYISRNKPSIIKEVILNN